MKKVLFILLFCLICSVVFGSEIIEENYEEYAYNYVYSYIEFGQTFTMGATAYYLNSIEFYGYVYGASTATAKIFALSGTPGSGGLPTGSPLATKEEDLSVLPEEDQWISFTFDGTYVLQANTSYAMVIESEDIAYYTCLPYTTYETHYGDLVYNDGESWDLWYSSGEDLYFKLYGTEYTGTTGFAGKVCGVSSPAKVNSVTPYKVSGVE